jgi:hypothetical protein
MPYQDPANEGAARINHVHIVIFHSLVIVVTIMTNPHRRDFIGYMHEPMLLPNSLSLVSLFSGRCVELTGQ